MRNVRRIINKHLSITGSHICGMSEIGIVGRINDPEGFLDNVCDKDVEKRLTIYISTPTYTQSKLDIVTMQISNILEKRGYLAEFMIS